jgi:glycosyltransferase involved in cell wall biosynthesis
VDDQIKPKRIACYALISKNSGSLASANFLIVEELLKRGYEIDLYGMNDFNYVEELSDYQALRYIGLSIPLVQYIWNFLEKIPNKGGLLYKVWARLSSLIYFSAMRNKAEENHRNARYDLTLFLGLPGYFRLRNIPTISWLQGPFQTEQQSIKKLKDTIISLCGIQEYLILQLFYMYSSFMTKKIFGTSDIFICGSKWAKGNLCLSKIDKNQIKVLPYPIDMDLFKPSTIIREIKDNKKIVFLWLGRIVPRKRLDLLLEVFKELIQEKHDVYLQIIGKFSYAKGYKKIIEDFDFPERLHYQESIQRLKVPEIMNSVDIIIQPSESENFGSSVAEALSCGIPVIVGSTNGTKDYLSDSAAWIFEEYSPACFKHTIEKAINHLGTSRKEISLAARAQAEKEFSIMKVVDELANIFEEAISAKNNEVSADSASN